jgi:exopolyphosphatase / guanosine-5'-triphosphate,3'-diphosphate pyrophosphatase
MYAAIDLGSNSFHMVVAEVTDGHVQVVDRMKEMVRLAGGLDSENNLGDEAVNNTIQCLGRFSQRIQELPAKNVRAVGTNTLRQAKNSRIFLSKVNQALGHRVEIISGREEARLIYQGVAHTIFNEQEQRLVIDIGGGSTELIIGKGFETKLIESQYMGCVNMSKRFFNDGEITSKGMRKAIIASRQELEHIEARYKKKGWDIVLGTSGTIISIKDVINAQGWSDNNITAKTLSKLRKDLVQRGHIKKIDYEGLASKRIPVFPGGVAILSAVFESLEIEEMDISDGALREGLLYDMIGRQHDNDIRDKTVNGLIERYGLDKSHADAVEKISIKIFNQISKDWDLPSGESKKLLRWCSRLHELGLAVSHSQYHKHGAYLLNNADLPGFSRQDQDSLGLLVRCHRRKFPVELFHELSETDQTKLKKLAMILRLSVILNRSRTYTSTPELKLSIQSDAVEIYFSEEWIDSHPLTHADLLTEADYLKVADIKLKIMISG